MHSYLDYQLGMGERILGGLAPEEQRQLAALLQKVASYMLPRREGAR